MYFQRQASSHQWEGTLKTCEPEVEKVKKKIIMVPNAQEKTTRIPPRSPRSEALRDLGINGDADEPGLCQG